MKQTGHQLYLTGRSEVKTTNLELSSGSDPPKGLYAIPNQNGFPKYLATQMANICVMLVKLGVVNMQTYKFQASLF